MPGNIQDFISAAESTEAKKEEVGIGEWTIFARVVDRTRLNSRAPAVPLEDGSFAQDHVILDPLELSIEGSVSEIFLRPSPRLALQRRLSSEVGNITQFLPPRTNAEAQRVEALVNDATDVFRRVNDAIDSGRQAINFFGNADSDSKDIREQFLDYMEKLHYGKQLIPIEMPYRVHENMRITELEIERDNQTEEFRFTIRAVKFRFAETEVADVSEFFADPSPGAGGQSDDTADKGAQTGEDVPQSTLDYLFNG